MDLFEQLFGGMSSANTEANNGTQAESSAVASGISFEEEKKPAKKAAPENKKEEKKKSTTSGKKVKDPTVELPLLVKARGWSMRIEGSGEKKLSEILKGLIEQGYRELALSKIGAVYEAVEGGDNLVYITLTGSLVADQENSMVFQSESGSVTVMDGELQMQVTPEMFDGLDWDEITIGKLCDRWVQQNPQYAGCDLIVEGDVAYPVFQSSVGDKDSVPETLVVNGEEIALDGEISAKDAVKKYYGESGSATASIKKGKDRAYLVYSSFSSEVKKGVAELKKNNTKAEQKYRLPLKVLFTTIGRDFDLTSDNFEGKEKITMGELKKYLSNSYKVFGDDKKQIESVYVEEENTLSLAIVSGRKG